MVKNTTEYYDKICLAEDHNNKGLNIAVHYYKSLNITKVFTLRMILTVIIYSTVLT